MPPPIFNLPSQNTTTNSFRFPCSLDLLLPNVLNGIRHIHRVPDLFRRQVTVAVVKHYLVCKNSWNKNENSCSSIEYLGLLTLAVWLTGNEAHLVHLMGWNPIQGNLLGVFASHFINALDSETNIVIECPEIPPEIKSKSSLASSYHPLPPTLTSENTRDSCSQTPSAVYRPS